MNLSCPKVPKACMEQRPQPNLTCCKGLSKSLRHPTEAKKVPHQGQSMYVTLWPEQG